MGKKRKKTSTQKARSNVAVPSRSDEERWKVDSAADTMVRMQEINANPKLKAKAKRELGRRAKAINKAKGA